MCFTLVDPNTYYSNSLVLSAGPINKQAYFDQKNWLNYANNVVELTDSSYEERLSYF